MKIKDTAYSYDKQKVKYTANRQTDPAIAALINNSLGDARTVLNFLPREVEDKAIIRLKADIESGKWEVQYGHMRAQSEFNGALRIIVSKKSS